MANKNVIGIVERLRKKYSLGFPDGYNEEAARDIRALFARIDELEAGLSRFARLVHIPNNTDRLLLCNRTDCEEASNLLDSRMSVTIVNQDFGIPAE